jgi:hypothetical protein
MASCLQHVAWVAADIACLLACCLVGLLSGCQACLLAVWLSGLSQSCCHCCCVACCRRHGAYQQQRYSSSSSQQCTYAWCWPGCGTCQYGTVTRRCRLGCACAGLKLLGQCVCNALRQASCPISLSSAADLSQSVHFSAAEFAVQCRFICMCVAACGLYPALAL